MAQGRLHCCLKTMTLIVTAGLASSASADSDSIQFTEGSLIIPMNANFQDACGTVSAYGLVWRLLQANQPGHYFALRDHPVIVYVAINNTKVSPNRCVPSNLSMPPAPSTDPNWNDGCDFAIDIGTPDPSQPFTPPVVAVDYGLPFPTAGFYPTTTPIPMMNTIGQTVTLPGTDTTTWSPTTKTFPYATPAYPSIQLDNTVTPRFTRIQYGGAPFIIDAADASYVLDFLANGDSFVPAAALAPFLSGPFGQCPTLPMPDKHYVQMHQATIAFTAPIGRRLNQVPPRIGVLDSGPGVLWESHIYRYEHVLDLYLKYGNLYYDDTSSNHMSSAGCPIDSLSNCRRNGSDPDAGVMYPGQIYDVFHSRDLISRASPYDRSLLNAVDDGGQPRYKVFWTPHWEIANNAEWNPDAGAGGDWGPSAVDADGGMIFPTYSEYVPNGDGAATQTQNSLNNIGWFLNQPNRGMMAECMSLASYEGTLNEPSYPPTSPATQSMFTNGIDDNELIGDKYLYDGRNCTDPDYASGECMLYRSSANPFAQIGDFRFVAQGGSIESFGRQAPTTDYRPGVTRLAVTWNNALSNPPPDNIWNHFAAPGSNLGWDLIDVTYKDNNQHKAAIIYIAGHEYVQTVAGVRTVLGILLNLGLDPLGSERALTAPVGFRDLNVTPATDQNLAFAATYNIIADLPYAASTFTPGQGAFWRFPMSRGHLRAHRVGGSGGLTLGEQALDTATLWDAEDGGMPPPGERNLFTYFGGYVRAEPSAPDRIIQDHWVPSVVAGTAIDAGCVDVMGLGQTPDNTFGMTALPTGDGICDLQEAVQFTRPPAGMDGGSGRTAYLTALRNDENDTKQMLQMARGYCFAIDSNTGRPVFNPTLAQCWDSTVQDNIAHVGGFAHATATVVPPSLNIPDLNSPDGGIAARPTVAYIGGLDGQLHAFYVSGGARYQGPQSPITFRSTNVNASTVFFRDWAAAFRAGNTPPPGMELWSFMPASQLALVRSNNARVDSSSVVSDVFADFSGSGLREWHTILVTSVGPQSREIFALDVTNPLKPQILWDLVGSLTQIASGFPYYSATAIANRPDPSGTLGAPIKWFQPRARFQLPPADDDPLGRIPTGHYDYGDMGSSAGLALGQIRMGLQPVYAVFVATNAADTRGISKGIEVFALNAATGQKLWQLEQPYGSGTWADNGVPPPVSLWPGPDGIGKALVGDQEGKVWEIEGTTGINVNTFSGIAGCPIDNPCKFPAIATESSWTRRQPISTTIALARLPSDVTGALGGYPGSTVLIFGTGGADWVPFSQAGELHVALLDQGRAVIGTPESIVLAQSKGMLLEPSPLPYSFSRKHIFGSITVSGSMVFFGAASVRLPIDVMGLNRIGGLSGGATYAIDLGALTAVTGDSINPFYGYTLANFGGGVTVLNAGPSDNYVVGLEVSRITTTRLSGTRAERQVNLGFTSQSSVMYRLTSWLTRFLNQ